MPQKDPVSAIRRNIKSLKDPSRARVLRTFFKTGSGQYGEGDIFLGLTVPQVRKLAREAPPLNLSEVRQLLRSPIHEERLLALLLLIRSYERGNARERERIYDFYLKNRKYVNNWDLVDISADKILGHYLLDKSTEILHRLAKSDTLWDRRIAMLATFHFVKQGRFEETLKIARILLEDREDLIHKAVGWMLREVGKRDLKSEEKFLKRYCRRMPRTMLRYAIERFPEEKRRRYLAGEVT